MEAYGLSNQEKYEVLNKLEEEFPTSIFAGEWEYGKVINYSFYSKRESNIPETFIFLFIVIMIAMIIVFVLTALNIIPQYLFR